MQEDPQDGCHYAQNVSASDHVALRDQNVVVTVILLMALATE